MKRFSVIFCATIFLLGFAMSAGATPNEGKWTLDNGINAGIWEEMFILGPGMPDNLLDAYANDFQWSLFGLVLQEPGAQLVGDKWVTTYAGGVLDLQDGGPWGDGVFVSDMTALNESYYGGDNGDELFFNIVITGLDDEGYFYKITLEFHGIPGVNYYPSEFGHSGDILDNGNSSLTLRISSQVPEPATLLLLGTGLIGLAGIGRKKFYQR